MHKTVRTPRMARRLVSYVTVFTSVDTGSFTLRDAANKPDNCKTYDFCERVYQGRQRSEQDADKEGHEKMLSFKDVGGTRVLLSGFIKHNLCLLFRVGNTFFISAPNIEKNAPTSESLIFNSTKKMQHIRRWISCRAGNFFFNLCWSLLYAWLKIYF